jgi:cation transport regulator ChaB
MNKTQVTHVQYEFSFLFTKDDLGVKVRHNLPFHSTKAFHKDDLSFAETQYPKEQSDDGNRQTSPWSVAEEQLWTYSKNQPKRMKKGPESRGNG